MSTTRFFFFNFKERAINHFIKWSSQDIFWCLFQHQTCCQASWCGGGFNPRSGYFWAICFCCDTSQLQLSESGFGVCQLSFLELRRGGLLLEGFLSRFASGQGSQCWVIVLPCSFQVFWVFFLWCCHEAHIQTVPFGFFLVFIFGFKAIFTP